MAGCGTAQPQDRPAVPELRLASENTIPAFRNAVTRGVDVLDFDLNLTADDHVALHHDTWVNSMICAPAPGSEVAPGPIRQMALDEIQRFDCGAPGE